MRRCHKWLCSLLFLFLGLASTHSASGAVSVVFAPDFEREAAPFSDFLLRLRQAHRQELLALPSSEGASAAAVGVPASRKRDIEYWYCSPSYPYYYYYCPYVTTASTFIAGFVTGEFTLLLTPTAFFGVEEFYLYIADGAGTGAFPVVGYYPYYFPAGHSIISQPGLFGVFVNTTDLVEYGTAGSPVPTLNGNLEYEKQLSALRYAVSW